MRKDDSGCRDGDALWSKVVPAHVLEATWADANGRRGWSDLRRYHRRRCGRSGDLGYPCTCRNAFTDITVAGFILLGILGFQFDSHVRR